MKHRLEVDKTCKEWSRNAFLANALESAQGNNDGVLFIFRLLVSAFEALKSEPELSPARIENLIQECREAGFPLMEDGALDEAAVQKLFPTASVANGDEYATQTDFARGASAR